MPPKKGSANKQHKPKGKEGGAKAQGNKPAAAAPNQKRRKHRDPYAEATGQTLDDIVKSIEQPVVTPTTAKVQAMPSVASSEGVTVAPKKNNGGAQKKPQNAQSTRNETRSNNNNNNNNKGSTLGRKPQPPSAPQGRASHERGTPLKDGMTKAQRKAEQLRRREAAKGRPLNIPDHFDEEEEENSAGNASNNEDYSDTQNERAKEYKKGGYHPVVVGDIYNDRYRVAKKLGWGYFSTVWLVWDYVNGAFQAMKVQKSAEHYREAAYDEIRLLSEIMTADPNRDRCCTRMNDFFEHTGPNGTHVCMVFDVLGENLLSLIEWYEYRGIPLPIVKAIAQQVLIGLEHIHSIDVLHTDLKPENVLLASPKHKILSVMKHYRPPPMHIRPSLVSKDVKTMTKSQRRRYYQKLKKEESPADAVVTERSSAPRAAPRGEEDDGEAESHSTEQAKDLPQPQEQQDGEHAVDEWGLPADDAFSEPDPEWEVERFHHVALADFGNSCWTYRQFTDEVQTRQYRSPEVIVGDGYSTPLDLWSAACMFFELITGEFLFDPKQGDNYTRDEDHLALMSELLGELPEHMRCGKGKYRSHYYTSDGRLRHIHQLNFWGLPNILREKYNFTEKKANEIAEFLLPMLSLDPNERASATDMLNNFQHFFEVQDDDYAPMCYVSRDQDDDDAANDDDDVAHDGDADCSDRSDGEGAAIDELDDGVDEEPQLASKADEAELKEWWGNHPLLNAKALARRGLTVKHVQRALAGDAMETSEQQEAVEALLIELEELEDGHDDDVDEEEDEVAED